jgi:hypothetical protein
MTSRTGKRSFDRNIDDKKMGLLINIPSMFGGVTHGTFSREALPDYLVIHFSVIKSFVSLSTVATAIPSRQAAVRI